MAGVSRPGPLRRVTEVVEHRSGADPSATRKSPGRTEFAPLVLERGVTHDEEFERWADKVWRVDAGVGSEASLRDFRKDLAVELLNEAGQVVLVYLVRRCSVLKAVEDLSRYEAATGHFQVIVDLEEDARFMPDFIRGERTLFVAAGTVEASVDFSTIGAGAVTVSPDGDEVSIVLPRARLSDARIDTEASRVVSRQRGLLDRLGSVFSDSPTGERQLYLLAEDKLEAAARAGGVVARAEENTRAMLRSMLGSLGFERVTVTFGRPAA